MIITRTSTVKTPDHRSLLVAWKLHGGPLSVVGRWVVEKPLTASQLRRLPAELRDMKAQLRARKDGGAR